MPNLRQSLGTGLGGWATANPIPAQELINQRLRGTLQGGGGVPPTETGPGLIQKLFDIISRPNYAIANTVRSLSHLGEREGGNPLEEFWQGLAGQDKTTFGDIIGSEWGVTGQDALSRVARGVGGFGLDVALDPLTYVSLGTSVGRNIGRATGRSLALRQGTERALKELNSPETNQAVIDALRQNLGKMPVKKIEREVVTGRATNVLNESSRALADANRRRLELRVGLFNKRPVGSTDVPSRVWEGIFGATDPVTRARVGGTGLGRAAITSRPVQSLNQAFRTEALGPDGLKSIKAILAGNAGNEARIISDEFTRFLRGAGKITNEELEGLYRHIQTGVKPNDLLKMGYSPEKVALYEHTQQLFKGLGTQQQSLGLIQNMADNFAPVYIKRGEEEAIRAFKRSRKIGAKKVNKGDFTIGTSMDANARGIQTVDRLDQVVSHYIREHFDEVSEKTMFIEAVDQYGIDAFELNRVLRDANATPAEKLAAKRQVRFMDDLVSQGQWKRVRQFPDKPPKGQTPTYALDAYLPRHIADSLNKLKELKVNKPEAKYLLTQFDKIQSVWKAFATIVNPGHHIRNLSSDILQSYTANSTLDPRAFAFAMASMGDGASGSRLRNVIGQLGTRLRYNRNGYPVWNVGGHDFTTEQVKALYAREGLHAAYYRTELAELPQGPRNRAGAVLGGARKLSEAREEWPRIATFITAAKHEARNMARKLGKPKLTYAENQQAFRLAAEKVREFHFDYTDLTPFEKGVAKRVIPFYTFMRKNLPHQLENIFFRPGQTAIVPKGYEAIRQLTGTDDWDTHDRIPQWLRESGYPAVGGTEENPTYLALDWPIQEALGRFAALDPSSYSSSSEKVHDIFRELIQTVSPIIRDPFELGMGQRAFNQQEIEFTPAGLAQYAAEQIPSGRQLSSVLNPEGASDNPYSGPPIGPGGINPLSNWLTGLGLQQATPNRQLAELNRQDDVLRALLAQLGISGTANA